MPNAKPNSLLNGNKLSSQFFDIEIIQVKQEDKIWDDRDSHANGDVAFWEVKPSPGFYSLGHVATNFYTIDPLEGQNAPTAITLRPKDNFKDLLVAPIGYEEIWNDRGTKSSYGNCNIWRMICPDGYVSLGSVVTSNRQKPKADNFRCIKKSAIITNSKENENVSLVTAAVFLDYAPKDETIPKALWIDKGTGAQKFASIWQVGVASNPANRNQAYLSAGTFVADNNTKYALPKNTPYALALNFPENDISESIKIEKFKLKAAAMPTDEELRAFQVVQEYYVPSFAIKDSYYSSQLEQFLSSPTYTIKRRTQYVAIDGFSPSHTETKEYNVTIGRSTESNYNHEVGVTLGFSVEVGGEAGLPVASTSVKITFSAELSYSQSWGGSTEESHEESFTYPQTVQGGCYGVLFQAKSSYTIYRQDGTAVGATVEVKTNDFYTDEWQPAGLLPDKEESSVKEHSPNTIVFTIDAPPGKTIIFEGKLEIRDGQLISLPTVSSI